MQLSHTRPVVSASFDDPNLVSAAGLVPVMALARRAGLHTLADKSLSVPTDRGANPGLKIASLVAGMIAGADSIDDMGLLRSGGMSRIFNGCYAPSTLGSFLRSFTFGHVRQLDAVASRLLLALAEHTELLGRSGDSGTVLVDVDDTVIQTHGHHKQGAAFGYSRVRGLNALLAIVSTDGIAPLITGQRLRRGNRGSAHGAPHLLRETLALIRRSQLAGRRVLIRADSAFYSQKVVAAAVNAGAQVSITVRSNPAVTRAIDSIREDQWTMIEYPDAIRDETTGEWISKAQVATVPFTAFARTNNAVPGRLVVRRVPNHNPGARQGQPTLFDTHRFHAFFTTTDTDPVTADEIHRRHAIIENVNADLKHSALAHLPSGKFTANAAWLVCAVIAFNLTRAAATLTGSDLARATTPTIRRKLINVPARISHSARKLHLHLPEHWPWAAPWTAVFERSLGPPQTASL